MCSCREHLVHNLSEQQANRLVSRLDESKIDSIKSRQTDGRWAIEVDRRYLADAIREMQKMRLLRENSPRSQESSSMIAGRDEQRFQYERALSAEIELTLASFSGVLDARVHLNLPQVDPLFGKSTPGAGGGGSVFIIADQSFAAAREDIAALVAGAAGVPASSVPVLIEKEQEMHELNNPFSEQATKSGGGAPIAVLERFTPVIRSVAAAVRNRKTPILATVIGVALIMVGVMLLRRLRSSKELARYPRAAGIREQGGSDSK